MKDEEVSVDLLALRQAFMSGAEWATQRFLPTGPLGFYETVREETERRYGIPTLFIHSMSAHKILHGVEHDFEEEGA